MKNLLQIILILEKHVYNNHEPLDKMVKEDTFEKTYLVNLPLIVFFELNIVPFLSDSLSRGPKKTYYKFRY